MEIQRAKHFGQIIRQLGIDPDTRLTYERTATGLMFWDLNSGQAYTVNFGQPPTVRPFVVPEAVRAIIGMTDEQLKKQWSDSWMDGWSEDRETIFTELTFRGISILDIRR